MNDQLTAQEAACLLRAARRQREALSQARERIIKLDRYTTFTEHQQMIELEAELQCIERAIQWLWRQRP